MFVAQLVRYIYCVLCEEAATLFLDLPPQATRRRLKMIG